MTRKSIIILLAIISIAIISWDYTSGHTLEDMVEQEFCPICSSFQSVELGVLFLAIILFLGLVTVCCYFTRDNFYTPSLLFVTIAPDRAPPLNA